MKNLETERLILRKIVKEDTEDIFNNWAKDPEVVRYLTWTNHKTVEDTKLIVDKWLEDYQSEDTYRWIVILKAYDIAIGMIDVVAFNKKDKRAEIGYCYGKKKDSGRGKPKMYQELAGKRFWAELTGDEDFYIKIIGYMGTMPEKYVADYKESYNKAANRLVREFSNSFCEEDGSIDWKKLVEFNSGD